MLLDSTCCLPAPVWCMTSTFAHMPLLVIHTKRCPALNVWRSQQASRGYSITRVACAVD